MADYDKPVMCSCGCDKQMVRKLSAPAVMNHALPDGTRRFDKLRAERAKQREKAERKMEENKRLAEKRRQMEGG